MFYQEAEIGDLLKCPKCKEKFTDPRFLTCGQTMCSNCIDELFDKQSNSIKCSLCNQIHQIPIGMDGFVSNKLILQLLGVQPKEVYRSKLVEELKSRLESLDHKTKTLKYNLKHVPDKIKEHTLSNRKQIDLSANLLIQEINKHRDKLLKELDEYEKECLANEAKNGPEFVKQLEPILNESAKFHDELKTYLSMPEIQDDEVSKWKSLTLDHLKVLSRKELSLKMFTFHDKTLTFLPGSPEINSSKIGTISLVEASIKLTRNFEIKTGEENEEVLLNKRCKLYRFDNQIKEWKEKGIGEIKILKHTTKKHWYRIVMRREQVLKICANHRINSVTKVELLENKLVRYFVTDFSQSEKGQTEYLIARFQKEEDAKRFKVELERIQTELTHHMAVQKSLLNSND
jgi:Ran-binding protein 1